MACLLVGQGRRAEPETQLLGPGHPPERGGLLVRTGCSPTRGFCFPDSELDFLSSVLFLLSGFNSPVPALSLVPQSTCDSNSCMLSFVSWTFQLPPRIHFRCFSHVTPHA